MNVIASIKNFGLLRRMAIPIACSITILMFFASAQADDRKGIEKLFVERSYDFYDIALNCSRLVADYYSRDKLDSVQVVLAYWEDHAGAWEPITRVKILLAIDKSTYSDELVSDTTIDGLVAFKYGVRAAREGRSLRSRSGVIDPSFDEVTQRVAARLLPMQVPGSDQYLICRFYSGDIESLFPALQTGNPDSTQLRRCFQNYAKHVVDQEFEYFALVSGAWLPCGARRLLGNHPTAGFLAGADISGYSAQITFVYHFLRSSNEYVVHQKDIPDTTQEFGLWYVGLDLGRQLHRSNRHGFHALLSLGVQGLNAVTDEDEDKRRQVMSGIMSVGIGYRYYIKPYGGVFLSIEPRYELSRMNTHATDLSGSAFTVRIALAFGSVTGNGRGQLLEELQHKFR